MKEQEGDAIVNDSLNKFYDYKHMRKIHIKLKKIVMLALKMNLENLLQTIRKKTIFYVDISEIDYMFQEIILNVCYILWKKFYF